MADEAFINFAKQRLAVGAQAGEITSALRINGLSDQEIEEVLQAAGSSASPKTAPPPPQPAPLSQPQEDVFSPPLPKRDVPDFPVTELPKIVPQRTLAMEVPDTFVYAGF